MESTKFEERLEGIMQAAHASTDTELANALGVKPPSVAAARKRGQIPSGWVDVIFRIKCDSTAIIATERNLLK